MFKINFNEPIHIHFIGIGGISMSGLAEILLKENFTVSGSDRSSSTMTDHLIQCGAKVTIGQRAENITDDIDLVVYTAAIHPDNEEFQAVVEKKIPMMTRACLLGQMMKNYKTPIAVSGTHGKTTTTSMISEVLMKAELDPTISVGGILDSIGGNIRVGNSPVFITEACEYTNSFLEFFPTISVILNVEEDHMDFFHNIQEIRTSFHEFAKKLPDNGLLVVNGDMEGLGDITNNLPCRIKTFGLEKPCNYTASNIQYNLLGNGSYDLVIDGTPSFHVELSVPGAHNILNSLSAIAVALELKIPSDKIQAGLLAFGGTKRRFEYKGKVNDITIIDDYAHHPTEIKATLTSAKNYPHHELWCVFQPHTYTRTKAFLHDFADALSHADHILLLDIYAAREKNTVEVSSNDILRILKEEYHADVYYESDFTKAEQFLLSHCQKEDLLITMGAGNVVEIGENILKNN